MEANPFGVLSFIVAPAILTNASSLLVMSTSNRLARAADRARELSKQLEETQNYQLPDSQRRLFELSAAEDRTLLLMKSLRSFYVALGGFASAALVSLIGAVLAPIGLPLAVFCFEVAGVAAGVVAVASLVSGAALLLRETQIAVEVINRRAETVRQRVAGESLVTPDFDKPI